MASRAEAALACRRNGGPRGAQPRYGTTVLFPRNKAVKDRVPFLFEASLKVSREREGSTPRGSKLQSEGPAEAALLISLLLIS